MANAKSWPWSEDRWLNRKEGIRKVIEDTTILANNLIEQLSEEAINPYGALFVMENEQKRLEVCLQLLSSLHEVVLPKFDDFHQRLFKENRKLKKFHPNYIFHLFLDRISIDLNLVQQALQQRRLQVEEGHVAEITHQGFVLHVASFLAYAAIQMTTPKGFTDDTAVITYLQNGIDVRLVPYANVALIGIPYGAMNSTRDWLATDYLAIPHELGHHLFWFKKDTDSESIRTQLIKKLWQIPVIKEALDTIQRQQLQGEEPDFGAMAKFQWYFRWLEEIFADAYCCRIAGPISALSFQELLANGSPTVHDRDDNKHPHPALRPLIQTKLLQKLTFFGETIIGEKEAKLLNENWHDWTNIHWQDWLKGDSILMKEFELGAGGDKLMGQEILEQLEPVLDIVTEQISFISGPPWTSCADKDPDDDLLKELYDSFTSQKFNILDKLPEPLDPTEGRGRIISIPRIEQLILDDEKLEDWIEQLLFFGWSTEGPQAGHSGS
jgi:hypothetical protein